MKKRNSRKIMIDAIAKVTAVAVVITMVIGIGVVVSCWDKIFPPLGQSSHTQKIDELLSETENVNPLKNKQEELPINNLNNVEVSDEVTKTDTPQQNEEIDQTSVEKVTNNEELAYNKETAQLIVTIATEQLGTPFKSGGDSPDEGFDSTGFTYYCANEAGVKFPRNLKDQLKSGEWVTFEELKAGDIVYFSHEVGGNAAFCGVYVGGGLIIYSPVPDDFVKTANITTNYWTTHFVTGLRLTSQTNE